MKEKAFTKLQELNTLNSQLYELGLFAYSLHGVGKGSVQTKNADIYLTLAEGLVTVSAVRYKWDPDKVSTHFTTMVQDFQVVFVENDLAKARKLVQDLNEQGCPVAYTTGSMDELMGPVINSVVEQVQAIADGK